MTQPSQPGMTFEADQSQRRTALALGIGSVFCLILGPFALVLGLRAHRRAPDLRASAAIILGGAASLILGLSLVATSTGLGMYLAAHGRGARGAGGTIPAWRAVQQSLLPRKPHQVVERVSLSADQKEFVKAYGWPDSFILGMQDDGSRMEVWQYFRCNSDNLLLSENFTPCRLSFINGKFRNVQHFEGSFTPLHLGYRPTEFDSSLTVAQITEMFGKPSLTRDPTVNPFGKIEILRYARDTVFMFREGKLWAVITLGTEG